MKKVLAFVVLFGFVIVASGCGKKQTVNPTADDYSEGSIKGIETVNFADEPSIRDEREKDANLRTVNFDFDRSDLTAEARAILKENANYLLKNPKMNVVVEGHTDDRGTIEYNLALGQRRAVKVKEFYVQLGIAPNRIATISYGLEKPVDTRQNETAWAKNRRAETKNIVK
ncbi:MAG: peptidoglycan-associated lipoprotein Pal [Endomicrobia bacterium]|nr:peptidoglycan-associated lipoprotein Pal [Endomicrobiia bacterium]MCL2799857.1 peptidoglycan-associated lipoprotein Pal [Endomicrobiia bacterium]